MRRLLAVSFWLLAVSFTTFGQSKLKYDLRVGTTGHVTLMDSFPESYSSEKINISIMLSEFSTRNMDSLDFVFADKYLPELGLWGDSIYHYTDEADAKRRTAVEAARPGWVGCVPVCCSWPERYMYSYNFIAGAWRKN